MKSAEAKQEVVWIHILNGSEHGQVLTVLGFPQPN